MHHEHSRCREPHVPSRGYQASNPDREQRAGRAGTGGRPMTPDPTRKIDGFVYRKPLQDGRYYADLETVIQHAKKLGYTRITEGWSPITWHPVEHVKVQFGRSDPN